MGFTPYSRPVEPAKWVDPMDLNLYTKSMMYKEQMAQQNLKSITDTYSTIMSVPAYGPDREKLAQIDQQFKQQLSSMNLSNLGDLNTSSQIKSLLGQYTTNADVLAIAQRGTIYKQMLKEKQEAEKKNKIYLNEGMDALNDYFGGSDYIQNLKFGNDGFTYEGAGDIIEKAKKTLTPDKKIIDLGKGQYKIVESYDPDKLKTAITTVAQNNPGWIKYHRYMNNKAFKDKNADDYAKQTYAENITLYESAIEKLNQLKALEKNPKNIATYDLKIKQLRENIDNTNKKLTNPYLGINFKNEMFQQSMNQDVDNIAEAIQFHADGQVNMYEDTKYDRQLSNQLIEKQYDVLAKGAAILGLSPNEVLSNPSLQPGAIEAGLKYEGEESYQKSLRTAEAKQKVKQETLGKLGSASIPPSQIITVGGVTQSKALWDAFIKKGYEKGEKFTEGDKSNVAAIVREFPEMFGLTPETTYAISSESIKIDSKGNIELETGFGKRNINLGDFSKLATGVSQAGIGQTSTSTTETGTSRISGGRGAR